MYGLWVVAILFLLGTTFTNFAYEDINLMAGIFLFFAALNSFFMSTRRKKNE